MYKIKSSINICLIIHAKKRWIRKKQSSNTTTMKLFLLEIHFYKLSSMLVQIHEQMSRRKKLYENNISLVVKNILLLHLPNSLCDICIVSQSERISMSLVQ